MKYILQIKHLVIAFGYSLILVCPDTSLYGQEDTIPPKVPTEWPLHTQEAMNRSRETLKKNQKAFNIKVKDFLTRCGAYSTDVKRNAACKIEDGQLNIESDAVDKELELFLEKFADNKKIYEAYVISKDFQEKEQKRIESIFNLGKPLVNSGEKPNNNPFGTPNTPKNPDLNDINLDLSLYWGGSKGTSPNMPDLNYGTKNASPVQVYEQKLAKKYPAFNEIVANENKLKVEEARIKKEGVAQHKQIKDKGIAATKDDLNKLKKITDDLRVNSQNLEKVLKQKEKAKNDYKVSDPF